MRYLYPTLDEAKAACHAQLIEWAVLLPSPGANALFDGMTSPEVNAIIDAEREVLTYILDHVGDSFYEQKG